MIQFSIFRNFPELVYGLSLKSDGQMRVYRDDGFTVSEEGANNRKKYFKDFKNVVYAGLKHSNKILVLDKGEEKEQIVHGYDGLITGENELCIVITVADCFPVYLYEPTAGIIGIAHCGWQGVYKEIIENILNSIVGLGGIVENILIGIGPGLQKCHFEIGQDLQDVFKKYKGFLEKRKDKTFLDLAGVIKKKCQQMGVPESNIEKHSECTYCLKDKYFSFRRDKPEVVQAQATYIKKEI